MRAPTTDPSLLLRAAGRCMTLARELDGVGVSVSRASGHTAAHWSGAGADAFGEVASRHRATVTAAQHVVERLGALSRDAAHELADEQERARRGGGTAAGVAAETRIALLRKRFGDQLRMVESDLSALLLHGSAAAPSHRIPPRLPARPVIPVSIERGPRCSTGPVAPWSPDQRMPWGVPWRRP